MIGREKKTKQKRRDRFTFNVQHGFEARTLIGAPRRNEGVDRSDHSTRLVSAVSRTGTIRICHFLGRG